MFDSPINVILVDDTPIIHEALKLFFSSRNCGISLIASAMTGQEAINLFGQVRADVALVDVLMPDTSGFEIARTGLERDPELRILFFSALYTEAAVAHARQIGAAGYLVKDSVEDLIGAIKRAYIGGEFICPDRGRPQVILPSLDAPVIPTEGKEALTEREIEVLRLTVDSLEVKEIAARLRISVRTVETHRAHIFQKLHTRSIATLTKYAISRGITSL